MVPVLTSSFNFELVCPDSVLSVNQIQEMQSEAEYDISVGRLLSIPAPVVELVPSECFTVKSFKVYDKQSNELVTDYLSVSGGASDS